MLIIYVGKTGAGGLNPHKKTGIKPSTKPGEPRDNHLLSLRLISYRRLIGKHPTSLLQHSRDGTNLGILQFERACLQKRNLDKHSGRKQADSWEKPKSFVKS